jgi:tetratricopeptide (TPR) repeat protein
MKLVGEALHWDGKAYEALPWHRGALSIVKQHPEAPDTTKVEVFAKLAVCLVGMERPKEALAHAEEAMEICRTRGWDDRLATARTMTIIGHAQADLDLNEESLTTFDELLAMCRRTPMGRRSGEDLLAQTEGNAGKARMMLDRYSDALALLEQGLARWRTVYPDDHPYLLPARRLLASCLQALGRDAEAVKLYEAAIAGCRKISPEAHPATASYLASLAEAMRIAGRQSDAVAFAMEGAGMARSRAEWDPRVRAGCEWALARALAGAGMIDDAVASAQQYLNDEGPPQEPDLQAVMRRSILAEILLLRSGGGDARRSESLAREAADLCRRAIAQGKAPSYLGLHVTGLLGAAVAAQDRFEEAQPLLLNARSALTNSMRTKAQLNAGVDLQREAEERLVWFFDRWHASKPDGGFDLEAARRRAALQLSSAERE